MASTASDLWLTHCGLSTLSHKSETTLSHKSETLLTFVRQSHFCETVSLFCDTVDRAFSATVSLLWESLTFVRQSHFSATVWTGLYIFSATTRTDQRVVDSSRMLSICCTTDSQQIEVMELWLYVISKKTWKLLRIWWSCDKKLMACFLEHAILWQKCYQYVFALSNRACLKHVASCLYLIFMSKNILSQETVSTYLRSGGFFSDRIIANLT